jgi:hypothetical protein
MPIRYAGNSRVSRLAGIRPLFGGWLNCAAFFLVGMALGGGNGKVENGHYYLMNHSKRTEVSQRVFAYSRAHQRSVDITHPIGFFLGGGLMIYAIRGRPHDPPLERTGPAE